MKIANPGASVTHGTVVRRLRVSLIMLPHSAVGGLAPRPRKLNPANVQHGGDEDWSDNVRQDVLKDELCRTAAGETGSFEIKRLLLHQCLAAGNAGILRPGDGGQRDDRVLKAAAKDTGYRQCEHQAGKSQKHVRDTHEHSVDPPAVPAAEHANHRADHGDNGDQQQCRENACPAADNHTGEHIPAVAVRSEDMGSRRRGLGVGQILQIGVIGCQVLTENRADKQDDGKRSEDDEARPDRIPPDFLDTDGGFFL